MSAFVLDFLEFLERLFSRLILILAQKSLRDRIRKSQSMHRLRVDGALRTFFVDHDADDLHIIGRIEFLQHFFRVRHLRHSFR